MSGGGGRGGGRKMPEEEHENHERWLVTYADMVTLLMVLFIVMFAMSQVDERKFNELREGLAAGFGASDSLLSGSASILDYPGTQPVEMFSPNQVLARLSPEEAQTVTAAMEAERVLESQSEYAEASAEYDRLLSVRQELLAALRKKGLDQDVRTEITDDGLVVSLVSRTVVFDAHLASLTERGREVVATLAPVLRRLGDPLQIDGHTNQVKVQPKFYDSDWDLAAARAITVLRLLDEEFGIPPSLLTASSFGAEKPLVDPDEPGSQQINKRVDIIVVSTAPSTVSRLLGTVAEDRRRGAPPAAYPLDALPPDDGVRAGPTASETTEPTETTDTAETPETPERNQP
ncbi:flagellar motor protein MotB [Nocardioidaceae bacterium]|nr:flagellar motor protein MotB [Nocardioidaceae bacterium]